MSGAAASPDEARAALAQALLDPRCVALVGASGDPAKNTARPQRYLRQHGYRGRIVPINPSRTELFGETAFPDIGAAPEGIDHAFVMVPASAVEDVVIACAARRIPLITVFSDGFAEAGPGGAARQQRLAAIARAGGSRLIGPNSIGVVVPSRGVALSVNAVLDLPRLAPGRLGLVSQSGSLIGAILSRGQAREIGFSAMVSIGNEADVSVGEVADLLVDDPGTDVIMLFLEAIRDAPALALASRRAAAAGKPMVAYVLGRSAIGQALAVTHTGALTGSAEATRAWLDAQGIVQVDHFETLIEIPPLLRQTRPPSPSAWRRRRLAVVTTTGGGAAMVVDRIDSPDIEVVSPPAAVIAALAAQGIDIGGGPVTDLTLAGTRRAVYEAVLGAFLESDHCDVVLAVAGSSAQFHPQHAVQPIVEAARHGKSLLAFAAPQADEALRLFARAGVPAFRAPESCADALRAVARWRQPAPSAAPAGDEAAVVRAATRLLREFETGALDEAEARAVFASLGVAQGEWRICVDAGADGALPLPAAVKILSRDIQHKTDIGGVQLGCATEPDARAAITAVIAAATQHHGEARIRGALVQRMESGIVEVILGYRRDPQVGAVVLLGIGGVQAEIYRDVVVRPAPVSVAEAERMIDAVQGLVVLRGYRGRPAGDRRALVAAVRSFSLLACIGGDIVIEEAEINPLLIRSEGNGVVALDAVLIVDIKGSS